MVWDDRRGTGGSTTGARSLAHSDEAKERADEATRVTRSRFTRWAPLVGAGALLLLGGGTMALVLVGSGDERRDPPGSAAASPAGTDPSARQSQSPTGSPTASAPTPPQTSISYAGTLRGGRGAEPFQMGVSCAGPEGSECNLTGYSLGGAPMVLVRTGPGSFRIDVPGERLTCAGASSRPVTGVVRLRGRQMTMTARSPRQVVGCPDGGSLEFSAVTSRFSGTYLEGGLPGFTVG